MSLGIGDEACGASSARVRGLDIPRVGGAAGAKSAGCIPELGG